ncbi:hypothetical protein FVW20_07100 [Desulfovibrio oxamicus]|uniref:Cytochrome c domain-containing protein n=1 Tax=Nitratidesulfovibrio oxamicus TaxID=32016 RepID=A0ABS0J2Y4_9BACT|nr:hypothetical protein [Nitratidesulfovibrio oxamicus]MBG3876797.1 hypothetical protein [Nitratidesulfovibrio oxamicus]
MRRTPTRRSRMPASLAMLAVSAALAAVAAFSLADPATAQDPAGTVMSACTKCHNTQRICANLGAKDKAAWNTTVTRMMGKGAQVGEAEKPAVVDWLAAQQPGAKPVCQ